MRCRYLKTQFELPNVPSIMRDNVFRELQDGVQDDTFDETCVLPVFPRTTAKKL